MAAQVGFKEWSVICASLGCGRQSIILRKGGIHEGRRGFAFEHQRFALFPTRFHEQLNHVRDGEAPEGWDASMTEYAIGDAVPIRYLADLEATWTLTDWKQIASLQPLHIWDEHTVRQRFEWAMRDDDPPALKVALVRVSRLPTTWKLPYNRGFAGCRSWVELPALPHGLCPEPVLSEAQHSAIREQLGALIG